MARPIVCPCFTESTFISRNSLHSHENLMLFMKHKLVTQTRFLHFHENTQMHTVSPISLCITDFTLHFKIKNAIVYNCTYDKIFSYNIKYNLATTSAYAAFLVSFTTSAYVAFLVSFNCSFLWFTVSSVLCPVAESL